MAFLEQKMKEINKKIEKILNLGKYHLINSIC